MDEKYLGNLNFSQLLQFYALANNLKSVKEHGHIMNTCLSKTFDTLTIDSNAVTAVEVKKRLILQL